MGLRGWLSSRRRQVAKLLKQEYGAFYQMPKLDEQARARLSEEQQKLVDELEAKAEIITSRIKFAEGPMNEYVMAYAEMEIGKKWRADTTDVEPDDLEIKLKSGMKLEL